jgi:hypothetical protein
MSKGKIKYNGVFFVSYPNRTDGPSWSPAPNLLRLIALRLMAWMEGRGALRIEANSIDLPRPR